MYISAQGFFMVLFTYEGLSLWGAQNGLPGWKRKKHFKEKWNDKIENSDAPSKMEAALLCAKDHKKFKRRMIESSFVRWTPPVVSLITILFYSVCSYCGQSATMLFERYSEWFCAPVCFLVVLQFVLFFVTFIYFDNFDAETLVADESKKASGFELAGLPAKESGRSIGRDAKTKATIRPKNKSKGSVSGR